jgi:hypothetical protein
MLGTRGQHANHPNQPKVDLLNTEHGEILKSRKVSLFFRSDYIAPVSGYPSALKCCIFRVVLDPGARRGWVFSTNAPAALPPGKTRYPLYRRLGWPQGRSGLVRKISPPPEFFLCFVLCSYLVLHCSGIGFFNVRFCVVLHCSWIVKAASLLRHQRAPRIGQTHSPPR